MLVSYLNLHLIDFLISSFLFSLSHLVIKSIQIVFITPYIQIICNLLRIKVYLNPTTLVTYPLHHSGFVLEVLFGLLSSPWEEA